MAGLSWGGVGAAGAAGGGSGVFVAGVCDLVP